MYKCDLCSKTFKSESKYDSHFSKCEAENRITDDEDENRSVSSMISHTAMEIDKLSSDKKMLKDELKRLMSAYSKKKEETTFLSSENKRLREDRNKALEQIAVLEKKKDEQNNKSVQQLTEKYNKSLEKLQEKILTQQNENTGYRERLETHFKDREKEIRKEVSFLETQIIDLKTAHDHERYNMNQVLLSMKAEKETFKAQILKEKDSEFNTILEDKNTTLLNLKMRCDTAETKLANTIRTHETTLTNMRVECEMKINSIQTEMLSMRNDYEDRLSDREKYYTTKIEYIEKRSSENVTKIVNDYEAKLNEQNAKYTQIIESLHSDHSSQNKAASDEIFRLSSELEYHKRSLQDSLLKKESEVRVSASEKFYSLKSEYEKNLFLYKQKIEANSASKDNQIITLTEQVNDLNGKLGKAELTNKQQKADLEAFKKQFIESINTQAKECDIIIKERESIINDLEKRLSSIHSEANEKLSKTKKAYDELLSLNDKDKEEITRCKTRIQELTTHLTKMEISNKTDLERLNEMLVEKVNEQKTIIDLKYKDDLNKLETELKQLKVSYNEDTQSLKHMYAITNSELLSIKTTMKIEYDQKIKDINKKHYDELDDVKSKYVEEINALSSSLNAAQLDKSNTIQLYENKLMSKLNEQKAKLISEYAQEIEKVSGKLRTSELSHADLKRQMIETLNTQRMGLIDDKKREIAALETTYRQKIEDIERLNKQEIFKLTSVYDTKMDEKAAEYKKLELSIHSTYQDASKNREIEMEKFKNEFTKKIATLQDEKNDLIVNNRKELNDAIATLKEEYEDKLNKIRRQSEEKINEYIYRIKNMEQEIGLLINENKSKVKELESRLNDSEENTTKLKYQLEDTKMINNDTIKKMNAERDILLAENRRLSDLEERLKSREETVSKYLAQINLLTNENSQLIEDKKRELIKLEEKLKIDFQEKMNQVIHRKDRSTSSLTMENTTLKERLSTFIEDKNKEIEELERRHKYTLQEVQTEMSTKIDSMNAKFTHNMNKLSEEKETIIYAKDNKIKDLEEKNRKYETDYQSLVTKANELSISYMSKLKELTDEKDTIITSKNKEIQDLENKLKIAHQETKNNYNLLHEDFMKQKQDIEEAIKNVYNDKINKLTNDIERLENLKSKDLIDQEKLIKKEYERYLSIARTEMENKINQYILQINTLTKEKEDISALKLKQISTLENKIILAEENLNVYRKKMDDTTMKYIDQVTKLNNEKDIILAEKKAELKELEKQIISIKEDHIKDRLKIEETTSRTFIAQINQLKHDKTCLERSMQSMKKDFDERIELEKNENINKLSLQLEDAENIIKSYNQQFMKLNEQIASYKSELEVARSQTKEAIMNKELLTSNIQKLQAEFEILKRDSIDMLDKQRRSLLESNSLEVNRLNQLIKDQELKITQFSLIVSQLNKKYEELEKINSDTVKQNTALTGDISKLQDVCKNLKHGGVLMLEEQRKSLEESNQLEVNRLNQVIQDLETKVTQLTLINNQNMEIAASKELISASLRKLQTDFEILKRDSVLTLDRQRKTLTASHAIDMERLKQIIKEQELKIEQLSR